jgi:23S rRNA pseudouridine1911/1915/1917 synthase
VSATVKLSSPATKEFWEIPVLFEDGDLLALDKPSGLLTSPDRYDAERPNLMNLLHAGIEQQKPWAKERNLTYLANAHRLDFETSGIILMAKNKPALITLANLFGSEQPVNTYLALAWGIPPEKNFEVDAKLSPHPVKIGEMRVDPKSGKKSKTEFEVLEQYSDWCLVRCTPRTSRTHQIRIHLKHAGFPIVGDQLYGGKQLWLSRLKRDYRLKPGREERPLMARACLHAEELTLPHPVTNELVTIKSEWPKDIRVALKYLRQYGTGLSRGSEEENFA